MPRARWVAWCLPLVVASLSGSAHAFVSPGNYQQDACRIPASILGKWRLVVWRLSGELRPFVRGFLEIGRDQLEFNLKTQNGGWGVRFKAWKPTECGPWGVRFVGASADWEVTRVDKDGLRVVHTLPTRTEEFLYLRDE